MDRTRALLGLVLIAASLPLGCSEDELMMGRRDLGVANPDGGGPGALWFQPGMRFEYRGTLTFRDSGGNESSALYTLAYTIDSVQDADADSTLSASASGTRSFEQNWDALSGAAGADSWIARVGPADATDTVGSAPVTVSLGSAPKAPPVRKVLPNDSLFFLDLRQQDALRAEWSSDQASLRPGSIDPSQHPNGSWVLTIDGEDTDMSFYPPPIQLRDLSLEYDPNGYLVRAIEILGDSNVPNQPNGRFELTLTSEPPQ